MGGSNDLINTLRDRIEFITEQHLQGKSSKLILFVLSQALMTNTSLREAAPTDNAQYKSPMTND